MNINGLKIERAQNTYEIRQSNCKSKYLMKEPQSDMCSVLQRVGDWIATHQAADQYIYIYFIDCK